MDNAIKCVFFLLLFFYGVHLCSFACLTGNSNVSVGVDTRRWTSGFCDHFWGFLLPPAFPGKIFCSVSVANV